MRELISKMKKFLFLCYFVYYLVIQEMEATENMANENFRCQIEQMIRQTQNTAASNSGIAPFVLEDKILEFLEKLRDGMGKPNEVLGLPALDPLSFEHLDVVMANELFKLTITLDNVVIKDLSKFIINYVKLNLLPPAFAINVTLPSLNAKGEYNANGNMGSTLQIGAGPFDIQVTEFSFNISIKVQVIAGGFLNITHIDLNFYLGNLHVDVQGLAGGGEFGKIFNDIINEFGTETINENEPQLSIMAAEALTYLGNKILNTTTIMDLLKILAML